ncbi:Chitobiase/beta-hexosaminidase C-terminal domain-containing protein [Fontimonas thermophila]|uniref:Chitobiase/beta-hexosaminidase C-terminal domain-containing protein n=1 Tax=Fontimonas thermophila TaxID=1076937 RepID=A0A1I2K4C9_9GAMM|nr:chitobiase/beta-hexosaminidase C-terminal domain-containing protein [Fontimonas thermophila]SFF62055.1 Chitobiase/beta-hexosaminidase C-terminal domain-containing protein [Fontimonas thermophila]
MNAHHLRKTGTRLFVALAAGFILAACAPREWLLPKLGIEPPRLHDFPADYQPPISAQTGQPMPGFGGGGTALPQTPVIFVHGNTVSARYWLPARRYFLDAGYPVNALWALGYGWDNVRYFDSNDLSVDSIERIVDSVTAYLSKTTGREIRQVDIVAHSLGVTLVRQWMLQTNGWHRVRNFVGACGANHGVWTAWPDARGQNRVVSFELAPGSPWLAQLNRHGETPGHTRYMMLYDGTGWADVLFPKPSEDSPALDGAYNIAYNREHGTYYDHLELPRVPETMRAIVDFLRAAAEPLPQAEPPTIVREGNVLRASQEDAQLHCTDDRRYPNAAMPPVREQPLAANRLYTCYAHNPRSGLSSPMARYMRSDPGEIRRSAPNLRASPPPGSYEQPQRIRLETDDPQAFIVYSIAGPPESGSPLYTEPIYIAGPVRLQALAIAPDGSTSAPLVLDYDISLELIEARRTLQRQLEPDTPVHYTAQRRKGR